MKFKYHLICEKGEKSSVNGDYAVIHELDDGLLAMICDGVGGSKKGDVAAKLCATRFYSQFTQNKERDYLNRIKTSLISTNDYINKIKSEKSEKLSSTTADVLLIKNNFVYWGHVGDSRIYTLKNKIIRCLTKDHSLVQKLVDNGLITVKEAQNHPNRNIMTTALGSKENLIIDVSKLALNHIDNYKFFLCTDGVFNIVTDSEIQKVLTNNSVPDAASELKKLIISRNPEDDYSFILIELNPRTKS